MYIIRSPAAIIHNYPHSRMLNARFLPIQTGELNALVRIYDFRRFCYLRYSVITCSESY